VERILRRRGLAAAAGQPAAPGAPTPAGGSPAPNNNNNEKPKAKVAGGGKNDKNNKPPKARKIRVAAYNMLADKCTRARVACRLCLRVLAPLTAHADADNTRPYLWYGSGQTEEVRKAQLALFNTGTFDVKVQ
jgi:hypothetical protein